MVRAMQPPTCSGLRVRSVADCNVIFHAVATGILPLISRRLTIDERRAIQSGCVFVWEERTPTVELVGDGLERWTDSRRWGASRLAKDFLLYQEKLPEVNDPHVRAAMHHNRLVKQTYSVYIDRPDGRRKWHLVAYSSPEIGHHMATIDNIPALAALKHQVPDGKYQAARYSKTRARLETEQDEPGQQQQQQASGSVIACSTVSRSGGDSSSPELPPPGLSSHPRPQPALISTQFTIAPPAIAPSAIAPPAIVPAPVFGPSCLPRIAPPIVARPDPQWVLKNYVAVSAGLCEVQTRQLLGAHPSKSMAPLVYMRHSPYQKRHPLDNDALRALDACH